MKLIEVSPGKFVKHFPICHKCGKPSEYDANGFSWCEDCYIKISTGCPKGKCGE